MWKITQKLGSYSLFYLKELQLPQRMVRHEKVVTGGKWNNHLFLVVVRSSWFNKTVTEALPTI